MGVGLPEFYISMLPLSRVLRESCFEAPKVFTNEMFISANSAQKLTLGDQSFKRWELHFLTFCICVVFIIAIREKLF